MSGPVEAVVVRAEDRPREGFEDPSRGDVSWATLFSADLSPTGAMSAGLAELPARGSFLALHRHAEPEIYYVAEGTGLVTVDGAERSVSAGAAVFIPGDAEHGIRNAGDAPLRFFYVFPVDRFGDVVYRFS